jgi:hypothetical protein
MSRRRTDPAVLPGHMHHFFHFGRMYRFARWLVFYAISLRQIWASNRRGNSQCIINFSERNAGMDMPEWICFINNEVDLFLLDNQAISSV